MLTPKITPKKRFPHKIDFNGHCKGNATIHLGQFGLKSLEGAWINNRQIEAVRKVLSRYVKSYGRVYINIFPHLAKTKKPLEVRMGSGKGSVENWVAVVKKDTIMFEIKLNDLKYKNSALTALKQAQYKLPIKCAIAIKE